jgi:predicted nucleic acid-binding protein
LPRTEATELEALIRKKTHVHQPKPNFKHPHGIALRDPSDWPLVELAISVDTDVLLSWDQDLLVLKTIGRTRVMTPRHFWDSLAQGR